MEKRVIPIIALFLLVALLPVQGRAAMQEYGFFRFTDGNVENVAAQFTVQVTDEGVAAGQALFKFINAGPIASSITAIYFRDGTLLGLSDLIDVDDNAPTWLSWGNVNANRVDFTKDGPVNPPQLPGGAPYGFVYPFTSSTATFFATDTDVTGPGVQPNGINPGESMGVVFDLKPNMTIDNVFTAISWGSRMGGLRIGLMAQAIGVAHRSDKFVNIAPVPVPAAVLLGMLGLGAAGLRLRRFA